MQIQLSDLKELVDFYGAVSAFIFAGIALFVDARVRRAQTTIEITKQHRALWQSFYGNSRLSRLFDHNRDLTAHPLTDEEVHFVNFVLQHLRATVRARSAGIFVQPEHLADDIRSFFTVPATRALWDVQKKWHDRRFVAFVERSLRSEK